MKTVANNVKCGEVIIFGQKCYLKTVNFPSNFVPMAEILSKHAVSRVGLLKEKFSGLMVSSGGGGGDWAAVGYPSN